MTSAHPISSHAPPIDQARPFPYAHRLADGRHLFIELPSGSVTRDRDGELLFGPEAVRLVNRMRVLACEVPDPPSPGWVRTLRETLGWTRSALARRLELDEQVVADWESGDTEPSEGQRRRLDQLRAQVARRGTLVEAPSRG